MSVETMLRRETRLWRPIHHDSEKERDLWEDDELLEEEKPWEVAFERGVVQAEEEYFE